MKELEESVKKVVTEELERANTKFPLFRSAHEGYAVIKEELEETENEFTHVKMYLSGAWESIKDNRKEDTSDWIKSLEDRALLLACESIQVAAMAQKFSKIFKEDEKNE